MATHTGQAGKIMVRAATKFNAVGLITDFTLNVSKQLRDISKHTDSFSKASEGIMQASGTISGYYLVDTNLHGQRVLHDGVLDFPSQEIRLRLYVDQYDVLFYDFAVKLPAFEVSQSYQRIVGFNVDFRSNGTIYSVLPTGSRLYTGKVTIDASPKQIETDYAPIRSLVAKADVNNTDDIYIMDISVETTRYFYLSPGDSIRFLIDTLDIVYFGADTLNDIGYFIGVG